MQARVYTFICEFAQENGFPPSYSEMAKKFNFSSDGTIRTYLEHLEKKGYIQRLGQARGLKLLVNPQTKQGQAIPIVGKIAAGPPNAAIETHEGTLADIPQLHPEKGRMALKIKGDSMQDAGILDGDLAIIQKDVPVPNGHIGAVFIDGTATLKRLFYEKDKVKLQPENTAYEPLYLDKTNPNTHIIGRLIAVVRNQIF